MIAELYDHEYDFNGFSKIRNTARAILINDAGELGYIYIKGEDDFGERNHYESCGGKIELGEDAITAVKREVLEESGYECDVLDYLGMSINRYNLISMISISRYYVCRVTNKKNPHRTDVESLLMHDIEFKSIESWLKILSEGENRVDRLVHQREYEVLKAYQSFIQ